MPYLLRFFDLKNDSRGSVYGPFSDVEIVDSGDCVKADGEIVARLFHGEWSPNARPWEKWREVSIEPHRPE